MSDTPSRGGEYREAVLDHHGRFCQQCTWAPETEVEAHKLHAHLEYPDGDGGASNPANFTVLCRDCHLNAHSESAFSHELVGRMTNALADALAHKRDGFSDRVARRVRKDSVYAMDGSPPANFANEADDYLLVEGLHEGDHYDAYFVDTTQPYLSMCSCYTHSFGTSRAHSICTHVGAAIVRRAIETVKTDSEEAALELIHDIGARLNEKAKEYTKKQELLQDGLNTLDIEDEYSESWAQRAGAQAKKMTKYGDEWKCFGSECEGCEIRLTADGYTCTDAQDKGWETKFPCPGKLGAYILDETGGHARQPDIDPGHIFHVTTTKDTLPVDEGTYLITTRVDDDSGKATFRTLSGGQTTIGYEALADAIITGAFQTTTQSDIRENHTHARMMSVNGELGLAPDVSGGDFLRATTDEVSGLTTGETVCVIASDDDTRQVVVETATSNTPFGGDTIRVSYETLLDALESEAVEQVYASDIFDIIATETAEAYGTTKVGFASPFEAKDSFKSLDWEDTHASWDSPISSKWSVDADAIDAVVSHLRDDDWTVWIPRDVRNTLNDKNAN